jgi:hypothetical protein
MGAAADGIEMADSRAKVAGAVAGVAVGAI